MKNKKSGISFKQKLILIFGSIMFSLIMIEFILQLIGLLYGLSYERNKKLNLKDNEYRILCIGESTTAPNIPDNSYPAQLQRLLNSQNNGIKYRVINEGICGASSADLLFRLEDQLAKYKPHLTILMAGTNDSQLTVKYKNNIFNKLLVSLQGLRIYKLIITGPIKLFKYGYLNKNNKISIPFKPGADEKDIDKTELFNNDDHSEGKNIDMSNNSLNLTKEYNDLFKDPETINKNITLSPEEKTLFNDFVLLFEWMNDNEQTIPEEFIKKILFKNPLSDIDLYVKLIDYYLDEKCFDKAEEVLNFALKIFRSDDPKYSKLYIKACIVYDFFIINGSKYNYKYKFENLIPIYEKLFSDNPENYSTDEMICNRTLNYYEYGNCPDLNVINKYIREKLLMHLMTTFKIAPDEEKYKIIFLLGKYYYLLKDINNAESLFKMALHYELDNHDYKENQRIVADERTAGYLLKIYLDKRDYKNAEELLFNINESDENALALRHMYLIYKETGETKKAEIALKKAEKIDSKGMPGYSYNYRKMCRTVLDKNMKVISMSYPNRNTEDQEKMLSDIKGIIFVSNDANFEEALKKKKINQVFTDMFGGDFGHCTSYGYYLIAKNLLPVVLQESGANYGKNIRR